MYVFMTGIFENGVEEKFVPLHRLTPSDKHKVNNIKTEINYENWRIKD